MTDGQEDATSHTGTSGYLEYGRTSDSEPTGTQPVPPSSLQLPLGEDQDEGFPTPSSQDVTPNLPGGSRPHYDSGFVTSPDVPGVFVGDLEELDSVGEESLDDAQGLQGRLQRSRWTVQQTTVTRQYTTVTSQEIRVQSVHSYDEGSEEESRLRVERPRSAISGASSEDTDMLMAEATLSTLPLVSDVSTADSTDLEELQSVTSAGYPVSEGQDSVCTSQSIDSNNTLLLVTADPGAIPGSSADPDRVAQAAAASVIQAVDSLLASPLVDTPPSDRATVQADVQVLSLEVEKVDDSEVDLQDTTQFEGQPDHGRQPSDQQEGLSMVFPSQEETEEAPDKQYRDPNDTVPHTESNIYHDQSKLEEFMTPDEEVDTAANARASNQLPKVSLAADEQHLPRSQDDAAQAQDEQDKQADKKARKKAKKRRAKNKKRAAAEPSTPAEDVARDTDDKSDSLHHTGSGESPRDDQTLVEQPSEASEDMASYALGPPEHPEGEMVSSDVDPTGKSRKDMSSFGSDSPDHPEQDFASTSVGPSDHTGVGSSDHTMEDRTSSELISVTYTEEEMMSTFVESPEHLIVDLPSSVAGLPEHPAEDKPVSDAFSSEDKPVSDAFSSEDKAASDAFSSEDKPVSDAFSSEQPEADKLTSGMMVPDQSGEDAPSSRGLSEEAVDGVPSEAGPSEYPEGDRSSSLADQPEEDILPSDSRSPKNTVEVILEATSPEQLGEDIPLAAGSSKQPAKDTAPSVFGSSEEPGKDKAVPGAGISQHPEDMTSSRKEYTQHPGDEGTPSLTDMYPAEHMSSSLPEQLEEDIPSVAGSSKQPAKDTDSSVVDAQEPPRKDKAVPVAGMSLHPQKHMTSSVKELPQHPGDEGTPSMTDLTQCPGDKRTPSVIDSPQHPGDERTPSMADSPKHSGEEGTLSVTYLPQHPGDEGTPSVTYLPQHPGDEETLSVTDSPQHSGEEGTPSVTDSPQHPREHMTSSVDRPHGHPGDDESSYGAGSPEQPAKNRTSSVDGTLEHPAKVMTPAIAVSPVHPHEDMSIAVEDSPEDHVVDTKTTVKVTIEQSAEYMTPVSSSNGYPAEGRTSPVEDSSEQHLQDMTSPAPGSDRVSEEDIGSSVTDDQDPRHRKPHDSSVRKSKYEDSLSTPVDRKNKLSSDEKEDGSDEDFYDTRTPVGSDNEEEDEDKYYDALGPRRASGAQRKTHATLPGDDSALLEAQAVVAPGRDTRKKETVKEQTSKEKTSKKYESKRYGAHYIEPTLELQPLDTNGAEERSDDKSGVSLPGDKVEVSSTVRYPVEPKGSGAAFNQEQLPGDVTDDNADAQETLKASPSDSQTELTDSELMSRAMSSTIHPHWQHGGSPVDGDRWDRTALQPGDTAQVTTATKITWSHHTACRTLTDTHTSFACRKMGSMIWDGGCDWVPNDR